MFPLDGSTEMICITCLHRLKGYLLKISVFVEMLVPVIYLLNRWENEHAIAKIEVVGSHF